jgi:hypothetical protein
MGQNIERDVRFLKRYAVAATAMMFIVTASALARPARHEKFTEIDVERINVMEPDGKYRLVISNRPRSIGPIYKGQPFGYKGGGRPGLIFFNDEGTENGGLTFTGSRAADGTYRASTHMSFDQFNQDQVLNLDYSDINGSRVTGVSVDDRAELDILDMVKQRDSIQAIGDTVARRHAMEQLARPNGVPLRVQRMFVGRDRSKNATLNLADSEGRARLRLVVDSLGAARIDFLDAAGRVTNSVTGASK